MDKNKKGLLGEDEDYKPTDFCDAYDITIEQFYKLTGPSYKDLTNKKVIIEPFLKSLNLETFEKLKNVVLGTLPKISINAETYIGPYGAPIIVFHDGLIWLIDHFKYIQTFREEENHSEFSRKYYLDELRKLQLIYLANGKQNEKLTRIQLSLESLTKSTIQVQFIKLFVFAHEFAHIYLHHLERNGKNELKKLSREILKEAQNYNLDQVMEFEADELAYNWFEIFLKSESDLVNFAKEKQIDFIKILPFELLYILNLFQAPLIINETDSAKKTHPSTLDRLIRLYQLNKSNLNVREIQRIDEMILEAEKQVFIFTTAKKLIQDNNKH